MWCETLSPLQCGISMERMLALLLLMMGDSINMLFDISYKNSILCVSKCKTTLLHCIKYSGLSTFLNSWKSDKGTKNQ